MQTPVKIKTASVSGTSTAILIIYTGGTFGMAYDKAGTLLKPFDFAEILEKLPELNRFEIELTFVSIDEPADSANFNTYHWQEMAQIVFNNYYQYDGFVILHGTDTMAYSASALSFMLQGLQKPVIFTGAQLPIGVARTDARENFVTSLEIASAKINGRPIVCEVCIYFNYQLLRGNRAKKVQSIHFDAFVSENYSKLAQAGVNIEYNTPYLQTWQNCDLDFQTSLNTQIATLKIFPGLQELVVKSILEIKDLRGVVIETYGSGNVPLYPWLLKRLQKSVANNIVVLNVSQCLGGKVMQGKYETSAQLNQIGVVSGSNITFEAGVAKMMFVLGNEKYLHSPQVFLNKPLCGEMDIDIK